MTNQPPSHDSSDDMSWSRLHGEDFQGKTDPLSDQAYQEARDLDFALRSLSRVPERSEEEWIDEILSEIDAESAPQLSISSKRPSGKIISLWTRVAPPLAVAAMLMFTFVHQSSRQLFTSPAISETTVRAADPASATTQKEMKAFADLIETRILNELKSLDQVDNLRKQKFKFRLTLQEHAEGIFLVGLQPKDPEAAVLVSLVLSIEDPAPPVEKFIEAILSELDNSPSP